MIKNVLSLFDGMSCGQIALQKVGIRVNNYFSSEIDKCAIDIVRQNFPDTKQIGNVIDVKTQNLPNIDLLIGGSPCQGFSYAGKQLNFNDEKSKLFFEYIRILKETRPKFFFLENVKMKKEHEDVISSYLGVNPIKLNSGLVSAQNRERIYWTNIPYSKDPVQKNIIVNDIIEKDEDMIPDFLYINMDKRKYVPLDEHKSKVGLECIGGIISDNVKLWDKNNPKILQRNFSQGSRVYSINGKGCTLTASGGGLGGKTGLYFINGRIRRLSLSECERMQTVPNGYLKNITTQQAWKLLGNGWTVDIISHFFKNLKNT